MNTRPLLLLLCALLAGASGLGLEVLGTQVAGLSLGYGRAGPLAISVFIAGWALGARIAGQWVGPLRKKLFTMGATLLLFALGLLAIPTLAGAGALVGALGTLTILLGIAIPQGMFLPVLARCLGTGRARDVSLLFAFNLAGAALGAYLFGSALPAAFGQTSAAIGGGLCALSAALLAAWCSGEGQADGLAAGLHERVAIPIRLGLVVAGVTAWVATLEWFGVRLGVLWLGGMQDALGAVLVATMFALALGAAILPRILPRGPAGPALLALLCATGSLWFFFLPRAMNLVAEAPLYLRSFVLVGPALVSFGAWIPLLQSRLEVPDAWGLGQLLGYEALGALVGLPVMHFLVLPQLGLGNSVLLMLGLCLLFTLLAKPRWPGFVGSAALVAFVFGNALHRHQPALQSPPLQNPAFELLAFHEDEHFAVSVVNDGLQGERTLLTDGFRAAASGHDYGYMRALAHLPLLMHADPQAVGVLAFGTGTTAGALSLHDRVKSLEVLELSQSVIDNAGHFEAVNRNVLLDPRVSVALGDGRYTLRQRAGAYDVLTMEPLLPDSPFAVYLYTVEFYAEAGRALKPGGLLCQWVPPHALEPSTFDAVVAAFTGAFKWSGVWLFGTQVILLGGDSQPELTPERFPAANTPLGSALAGLGLQDPVGIAGRYLTAGTGWPTVSRPLHDLDPWVIYRARRRGSVLLADLPLNLAKLRRQSEAPPSDWWEFAGEHGKQRFDALSFLRRAREAIESDRALASLEAETKVLPERKASLMAVRSRLVAETEFEDSEELLQRVRRLAPNEPGLLHLEAAQEFQECMRTGYALLLAGESDANSGEAAVRLMRAVVLRPERADAHAYLAAALFRLGSDRTLDEIGKARELCPNLRQTVVGSRLDRLGFWWGMAFPPFDSQGQKR